MKEDEPCDTSPLIYSYLRHQTSDIITPIHEVVPIAVSAAVKMDITI
jgi:hypothetical protein